MNKHKGVLSILLSGMLSATFACADQFTGLRMGAGLSQTSITAEEDDYQLWKDDYGEGIKLEAGYDFNQMLGVAISYETNRERIDGIRLRGESFKLSLDLGGAFPVQDSFIKPYAKLGLLYYSEQFSSGGEFDDDNLFIGIGIRFQQLPFYADLSLDYYQFADVFVDTALTQTALTLGYKF